jgi:hypothetical protein
LRRLGLTLERIGEPLAERGAHNSKGRPLAPGQIARMLTAEDNRIGREARAS